MSVRMRLSIAIVILACVTLSAATDIKLATLVPANTSWHKALLDMGNTWNKDTAGGVKLTPYHGGGQGGESANNKKKSPGIETLQHSFFTPPRLAELYASLHFFALPF